MVLNSFVTRVKNTSGYRRHYGFLGDQGVTLAADAIFEERGDLMARLTVNDRDALRSLQKCLQNGSLTWLDDNDQPVALHSTTFGGTPQAAQEAPEPTVTEPEIAEPTVTEPEVVESTVTEPEVVESNVFESSSNPVEADVTHSSSVSAGNEESIEGESRSRRRRKRKRSSETDSTGANSSEADAGSDTSY